MKYEIIATIKKILLLKRMLRIGKYLGMNNDKEVEKMGDCFYKLKKLGYPIDNLINI